MEKQGFIVLHPQTGSKITGLYDGEPFICTYVDDYGPKGHPNFQYGRGIYKLTYISGCFCPYVELIKSL